MGNTGTAYTADLASLRGHPLPAWFSDAKLGIFVHWYPATIPAYAPLTDDPFTLGAEHGWEYSLSHSPYAEWYQNSLSIPGSPVALHHAEHWPGVPYDEFVARFAAATEAWDPAPWAELFVQAGARYVVMGAKHHDGVTMWPSRTPNPHRAAWSVGRNTLVELADEVRRQGLRYGIYYSGGLDWTFGGLPIDSFPALIRAIPQTPEYCEYVDAHWREIIEMVGPDVLWNDIAYPRGANAPQLFADYYGQHPDGLVNDRFDMVGVRAGTAHADFVTPEYSSGPGPDGFAFEVCRGIGRSFGYNHLEPDEDYLAPEALIRLFVDIVADGGNLLLNVGPTATGEIPMAQASRLHALGWWLRRHGDAIYRTRPWTRSSGSTSDGGTVRYTCGPDGTVYAIVLDPPPWSAGREVEIDVRPAPAATVRRLGDLDHVTWQATDRGCRLTLATPPPAGPPVAFALSAVEPT
jgi:alpha-L-fucosidase